MPAEVRTLGTFLGDINFLVIKVLIVILEFILEGFFIKDSNLDFAVIVIRFEQGIFIDPERIQQIFRQGNRKFFFVFHFVSPFSNHIESQIE